METLYFVDSDGNYLGGFTEGNPAIPEGAIQVDLPPNHGWQKYANGEWQPLTPEQQALIS